MFESDKVEFKLTYTEEIKEEVVAFLNTDGGTIYVGIDKEGTIVGLDNPDLIMQKLTASIRHSIKPDCGLFVRIASDYINDKPVVIVYVAPGKHTPYYIGEKGIKPSGVFIRVGTSKVQAQKDEIHELFDKSQSVWYEDRQAPYANLTFNSADKVFAEKEVGFSENNKKTLGLIAPETGLYTNIAYLLSDQCEFSIKCSVFKGSDHIVVKDNKEFSGSLFDQMENTLKFIDIYNVNSFEVSKVSRKDFYDYPPNIIREGILNALIHRDYTVPASTFVKMFDDRIEISSFGGLVHGVTAENMRYGISNSRNPHLCQIFHRLQFTEAYGYGIPKIYDAYRLCNRQPEYSLPAGLCQLILPNQRYYGLTATASETGNSDKNRLPETANSVPGSPSAKSAESQTATDNTRITKASKRYAAVKSYLQEHNWITKNEAAALFGTQPQQAYIVLEKMANKGLLKSVIDGRIKTYRLP